MPQAAFHNESLHSKASPQLVKIAVVQLVKNRSSLETECRTLENDVRCTVQLLHFAS